MDELFSLVANQMTNEKASSRAIELVEKLYAKIDALSESNAKLAEALAFYADVKSWVGDDGEQTAIKDSDCYRNTNMNDDLFGGLKALKSLADHAGAMKRLVGGEEGV